MKAPFSVQLRRNEQIGGWLWLVFYEGILGFLVSLVAGAVGRELQPEISNGICMILGFLGTMVLFRRFLGDSLTMVRGNVGKLIGGILLGAGVYISAQVLIGMLTDVLGISYSTPNDDLIASLAKDHYRMMWAETVLLSPVIEETLLRGVVFGTLRKKNRPLAYVGTGLIFAGMHILAYLGSLGPADILMNLVIYGLPGASLCVAYEKADNIWAAILLHMMINMLAMASIGWVA